VRVALEQAHAAARARQLNARRKTRKAPANNEHIGHDD
jgi:hypothetical protein